jgi:protocatechuate 3,4-dioxygenase beta subunit
MRFWLALILILSVCVGTLHARETIIGLPCEGCEAVFEGIPQNLQSRARIGRRNEPGQPMIVMGKVVNAGGKPASGVVVYAYQTNNAGIYPTSEETRGTASHRHGLLRAWALTDAEGRYAFDTIRPAGYPNTDLPAHIHMHIIERGCSTYYIDDIMFKDDPRLTSEQIRKLTLGRGGDGINSPRLQDGVWYVTRDIVLGKNIPGHRMCGL